MVVVELRSKKQEEFVQKVVQGMPQREAFRSVYKNKMTDAQVDVEASAMLNGTGKYAKNPKIHQRFLELNAAAKAKAEKEAVAGAVEVLKYLTSVLRGESRSSIVVVENIGDFMSEAREMQKAPDEKERLRAAELLGKRYSLFTDKVQQEIDMDLNITVDYGDDGDDE